MPKLAAYRAVGVRPVASPIRLILAELRKYDRKRTCRARQIFIPVTAARGAGSGAHRGRHMQLKLSAQAFLQAQGKFHVTLEQDDRGRVYDVAAICERIAVEVGQTQVLKLLSAARDGALIIWLLYRCGGDYHVGDLAPAVALTSPQARARSRNTSTAVAQYVEDRRRSEKAYAIAMAGGSADEYVAALLEGHKPQPPRPAEFVRDVLRLPEPYNPEPQKEMTADDVDWDRLAKAFPFM